MTKEAASSIWKDLPWLDELREVRASQSVWAENLARAETPMHALFVHKIVKSMLRSTTVLSSMAETFAISAVPYCCPSSPSDGLRFQFRDVGIFATHRVGRQVPIPTHGDYVHGDGAFGFNAWNSIPRCGMTQYRGDTR